MSALTAAFFAALLGLADSARAAYTARVDAGTLRITGNAASDKLVLRLQSDSPGILEVDVGADGSADFSFDRATFTAIDVQARGGDDEVRIDQSAGAFTDESVTINGGGGADTIVGGSGGELHVGGGGNDVVAGGGGNDQALLGSGHDRFVWNPGDGSDVVEGQGGNDTLDFNGSNGAEIIKVAANAGRTLLTRNVGVVTTDFDGIEGVIVHAIGSADTIVVDDLTGTDVASFDADLSLFGSSDGAADSVLVYGTGARDVVQVTRSASQVLASGLAAVMRIGGSLAADDTLWIGTLGGDDDVFVAPDIGELITTQVDLGADD